MEVEKEIAILKKEVESLKSQVRTIRVFYRSKSDGFRRRRNAARGWEVMEVEKEIAILKKEVESLKSQVRTIRVFYLTVIIMFVSAIINFQIQYSQIRSYYQATVESNQEILLNLKWQNFELQRSLLMIEEILPD